mmetsp:Transcript_20408/g.36671  ORF Transcript_20408/g.36671 Transcript_20408/m.36671 type:complete len:148 (-) Transcript_20408:225-668(-)|eukprot:CAMPEP_0201608928 /NCGR_PEP_ID=MMETSP0492-20130828/9464_1 /ASSEMBLY_ACC=CAM_ASM_000837 /TAXON_ID=420259 /ORGANISM="Thalassiosira gravida, Strain GMp14c1" /LENGTH=147 /DNA_ID=CAMNT_0048073987 /DNA_START=100 /DNA_END=543 /DNA_ORIENTATION=-
MADNMSNSIPVMRKPSDELSNGLNSSNLAASAMARHPIDQMQRANAGSGSTQSPLDLDAIRRLYGSGLAMRLATERQMALKVGGRLPGLDAHPDSRAMYETLTGDDVSIGFGDFLNLRKNSPEVGGISGGGVGGEIPHSAMESKLGL